MTRQQNKTASRTCSIGVHYVEEVPLPFGTCVTQPRKTSTNVAAKHSQRVTNFQLPDQKKTQDQTKTVTDACMLTLVRN